MSLDGIWTTEFHGQMGWENVGVLVMQDGAVAGGNNSHFSHGSYTESGDEVTLTLAINFHGTPRTVFGEREKEFTLQLDGKRDGDTIVGTYFRTDKPKMTLNFRAVRRADFP